MNGLTLCTGKPPAPWEEIDFDEENFCLWLFGHLEHLMSYLAQRYPQYFDFEEFIPYGYMITMGTQFMKLIRASRQHLPKIIGQALLDVILQPSLPYFYANNPTKITYHHAFYVNRFMMSLPAILTAPQREDEQGMHMFLHKIEFNSPEYIQYHQDYMRRQIRDTSPKKTIQVISDFKTLVIQYSDQQADPLYPQGERLVSVMTRWLDAELAHIQQAGVTETPLTVNQALGESEEKTPKEKALFNGAVKELGLLLRLAVEADLINDVNIRKICRQASALFSTVNTEEPSEKSIYKSFFSPEPIAIEKLIPILKKLLDFLQQPEIPHYVKKDKRGKNPEKN
jgi:hypothetical protein